MRKTIFKRCGCRHPETGRQLGAACPRLRRPNGAWHSTHGTWHYQTELPPTPDGKRRPLRRGGLATSAQAQTERDHIAALLAIAEPGDTYTAARLGDLISHAIRTRQPLPTLTQARLAVHAPRDRLELPALAEWLPEWLAGRRALKRNTYRSYESHLRLYLIPHLGPIRIDRLTVGHINDMYDAISERNDHIRAARASGDPARIGAVKTARIVGASSIHKLHGTLRAALNAAIVGAMAAGVVVIALGVVLRHPLTLVPENWLKFGVGAILSAFGVFWFSEGLGVPWPGDAASLLPILAAFLGASWLAVRMLRSILPTGAHVEARNV